MNPTKFQYLHILSFFLIVSACAESPLSAIKGDSNLSYNESLEKWDELKNSKGDAYFYTVSFTSAFGFGADTKISVKNGEVFQRSYEAFSRNEQGEKEITNAYVEEKAELGTHSEGAPPKTLDELYKTCADDLKKNPRKNTLYFNTFDTGILSICGYVPNGCQDDCFRGVRISEFEWL